MRVDFSSFRTDLLKSSKKFGIVIVRTVGMYLSFKEEKHNMLTAPVIEAGQ